MNALQNEHLEHCWYLTGRKQGRVWYLRRHSERTGQPHQVAFDAGEVLQREETRGDVVGFLHTHPNMPALPSTRDLKTMRAWTSCFGKPLLCLIEGSDGLQGYLYENDESGGIKLDTVEAFPRGILIGVEHAG
ncbi:MAG TPA: Mov34/MPN/PAD-1 family protein [Planctomycetaceae bacterium]|nr:Mov34/MPN/PAD-1 family protein [Planctomycetaceae bacterium]